MWTCPKCGERIRDDFEVCWSCGTSVDGVEDPEFAREPPVEPAPENLPLGEQGTPDHLVTVARCSLPAEAHALRLHLEAAGIPVFLADEFTVSMDWLLSNAVGGIKVQVPRPEADRARAILEEREGEPSPEREKAPDDLSEDEEGS